MSDEKITRPFPEPGIYIHMPEEVYHEIEAVSKSFVHAACVSPIDAWEFLNGERNVTDAMLYGSAFHAYLLEGKAELRKRFHTAFNPADYPEALRTAEDLKRYCEKHELAKTGKKEDLIDRIQAHDRSVEIVDVIKIEHEQKHKHTIEIPPKDMDEILTREWVREVDFLADENKRTEISFFWYDEKLKCNCKARLDSLSVTGATGVIGDVKTFTNSRRKNIEDCVAYETGSRQYHVDASFYIRAVKNVPWVFHECADPPNWERPENIEFRLLYVEKGRAFPNVLPRELLIETLGGLTEMGEVALTRIQDAANLYNDCTKHFGAKPWNRAHQPETLDESQIPTYLL